jgi:hypothetical protein
MRDGVSDSLNGLNRMHERLSGALDRASSKVGKRAKHCGRVGILLRGARRKSIEFALDSIALRLIILLPDFPVFI